MECAFEAVEDEIEPVLELPAVAVAGLEDVLDGELGRELAEADPDRYRPDLAKALQT